MPSFTFTPRVLYLTEDENELKEQLSGKTLRYDEKRALIGSISTDEITPGWVCYYYDERLGDFPYLGLKCGERFPVKEGRVRAGGFSASVAGRRRGKGSSREASPYAEWCAGIRLVIAEGFERIYRQNCQNLGLLVSTDFGLVERIRAVVPDAVIVPFQVFLGDPAFAKLEKAIKDGGTLAG